MSDIQTQECAQSDALLKEVLNSLRASLTDSYRYDVRTLQVEVVESAKGIKICAIADRFQPVNMRAVPEIMGTSQGAVPCKTGSR